MDRDPEFMRDLRRIFGDYVEGINQLRARELGQTAPPPPAAPVVRFPRLRLATVNGKPVPAKRGA